MAQKGVEIAEIAQAAAEFALGKKVDGAMQHHVGGGEHGDVLGRCDRDRRVAQALAFDGKARGRRHDRVMDVDRGLATLVLQRRQLVHPFAVVALIVSVGLCCVPSGRDEQRFGVLQQLAR